MKEEREDPDHVHPGEIDVPGQEVEIGTGEGEIDHQNVAGDAGTINFIMIYCNYAT